MSQTLTKQSSESRVYSMDFSANMQPAETVVSVDSFTVTPAGLTYTSATPSGQTAVMRLSGGVSVTQYKVTLVVTTSEGNVLEDDGYLLVKDK